MRVWCGRHQDGCVQQDAQRTESRHMSTKTMTMPDQEKALQAYYGTFTSEKEKAVLSVPLRLVAAWSHNDASGVADVFTEDGILILPGDVYKNGREEIRSF